MARKPNYRFERSERDRQKALKKESRLAAKKERAAAKENAKAGPSPAEPAED